MTDNESRNRLIIAGALSLANIALVTSLVGASVAMSGQSYAQGQNSAAIEKPNRAVACPSGWRHPNGNTKLCEPMGSSSPKIYAKKAEATCAGGYFKVYRVWCSTRK
ncbi:hypothetical protein LPB140_06925 [Sphingorhabdus lutea]|uniref:Uncharacterized protein n=1 Tax=Sphingorhabdus lutea TaxID=1913578 RepID=A0A1L3JBQ4_9SPHN|nr:hypothetical protein [Sphingorhabdus lutea]APG62561.1 hypothetical protein LPB140_06925 [Sphingorhabdus lutea]